MNDPAPEEVSVDPAEMPELESVREPETAEEAVQPGDPTFDEIWNPELFASIGLEEADTFGRIRTVYPPQENYWEQLGGAALEESGRSSGVFGREL